jgi:hypothetical protein
MLCTGFQAGWHLLAFGLLAFAGGLVGGVLGLVMVVRSLDE